MSLDRSPSPQPNGGWAVPGLDTPYDEDGAHHTAASRRHANGRIGQNGVTWASARARSARVSASPSYRSQNQGFFGRHMRRISSSLPMFSHGGEEDRYEFKEKPLPGRTGRFSIKYVQSKLQALTSSKHSPLLVVLFILVSLFLWYQTELTYMYRHTSWLGGGSKFVIILGANEEGGVQYWKGPREWAIERVSLKNKRAYAERWGYHLDIVDLSAKRRYAHEWRESWEKADFVRDSMKKFPDAEWFWWLDLNTYIMEPSVSLQSRIFDHLGANTYRDINLYNPLGISHPPNGTSGDPHAPNYANYLDEISLSAVGDGKPESINMVIAQDCGGFSLGSFFTRRSAWTDNLLDIWWDPVFYEQRHMEWEHKEQDALEYLYINQPWVRPHIAFAPQRLFNSFPHDACGEDRGLPPGGCKGFFETGDNIYEHECGLQGLHYQQKERDFAVTLAGCEWGRDCWGEISHFKAVSDYLNLDFWDRFKNRVAGWWNSWKHPAQHKQQDPPRPGLEVNR